jgi:hypothetical protein
MSLSNIIVQALPAAGALGGACLLWRFHNKNARRQRLISEWEAFTRLPLYADVEAIPQIDNVMITQPGDERARALKVLGHLERMARLTGAKRLDWEQVLPLDDHARIRGFIIHCDCLIQLVRKTQIPVEVHVWNGHRNAAFANIRRIFQT